jgi:DNA-binding transcriptional MerR regulator
MIEWRIKELSDMTQVSIRMLRHYDKIGLLRPSYRADNGYRYYNADDLAKLQQIIALKSFGFTLSSIKNIVDKHNNVYAHLQTQHQVIKQQRHQLQQVDEILQQVLNHLSPHETPDWHHLITLIERYQMTQNLRNTLKQGWAGKNLTSEQFVEYLSLYETLPEEFAARDALIQRINNQAVGDPDGLDGESAVLLINDLVKKLKVHFAKQIKLGSSLLQSIQSGQITSLELTSEGQLWISRAILAYWIKRWNTLYENIVTNLSHNPEGQQGRTIAHQWQAILDDYFWAGPRAFLTGILLWNDVSRQQNELGKLESMLSPQEMLKKVHIPLLLNPEAITWITRALEVHL